MKKHVSLISRILAASVFILAGAFIHPMFLTGLLLGSTQTDVENIFSKCIPAIRTNIRNCGLMTLCDASVPRPEDLDGIYQDADGDWRVMEAPFMHQMEMKFCQVKEYNLYNYLMANKVDMSKKMNVEQVRTGLVRIRPYILVERKAVINNNYWKVTGGLACDLDGTPNGSGTYWRVDATSPTGIPANVDWFNTPERVFISGQTEGGSSTKTAWKVKSCSLFYNSCRIVLESQNTNSFLPPARLASPVTGMLERGTANVNDFESFCARGPGLLTNNEDEFWIETVRDAQCIDEKYTEWRDLIMDNNPLYKKWFDLSPIEYNRQSGEDFQKRFVTTAFFSKALEHQTISTVKDLETITTEAPDGTSCVGKRANVIGIYEQHAQHNRVYDHQGTKINLPQLFKALYKMQLLRQDLGQQSDVFEIAVPSQYIPAWNLAMLQYYKAQSGGTLEYRYDIGNTSKVSPLGFVYTDYKLVWPNITIRIVTDRFFDDYLAQQTDNGTPNIGRYMWIADWSRIYIGIVASERVVNKTGDVRERALTDPSYLCVMKVFTKTVTMTSWTYTVICETPQANLFIENFNGLSPEPTIASADNYDGTCNTTTTSTSTTSTTTTTTTTGA